MRAGSLRHRVVIEQPTVIGRDSFNGDIVQWDTFTTGWASIEQMKSFDKSVAAATWPGADTIVNMRGVRGTKGNMRIAHGPCPCGQDETEYFSILGKPNNVDGRNREMILTCELGVKAQ